MRLPPWSYCTKRLLGTAEVSAPFAITAICGRATAQEQWHTRTVPPRPLINYSYLTYFTSCMRHPVSTIDLRRPLYRADNSLRQSMRVEKPTVDDHDRLAIPTPNRNVSGDA